MISKLVYDEKFARVMKHVFSKTLICRNIETATQIARTQNLDCITLDGEYLYIYLEIFKTNYYLMKMLYLVINDQYQYYPLRNIL